MLSVSINLMVVIFPPWKKRQTEPIYHPKPKGFVFHSVIEIMCWLTSISKSKGEGLVKIIGKPHRESPHSTPLIQMNTLPVRVETRGAWNVVFNYVQSMFIIMLVYGYSDDGWMKEEPSSLQPWRYCSLVILFSE